MGMAPLMLFYLNTSEKYSV